MSLWFHRLPGGLASPSVGTVADRRRLFNMTRQSGAVNVETIIAAPARAGCRKTPGRVQ